MPRRRVTLDEMAADIEAPETFTEDLGEIAALVESGVIQPHISKVLPLDQARQAMDLNQQAKIARQDRAGNAVVSSRSGSLRTLEPGG